jgi:hypothetical protein
MVSQEEWPGSHTPTVYSREEAEHVRTMAMNPDLELVCPRCDEALTIGKACPKDGSGGKVIMRRTVSQSAHRSSLWWGPVGTR